MAESDYPQAATRHLRDACLLRDHERWASAAYLSGYVLECALKALLAQAHGHIPHTHDLRRLRQAVKDVADGRKRPLARIVRAPFALRLSIPVPAPFESFTYPDEPVCVWHPSLRYQPESAVPSERAREWVKGAQGFHALTVGRIGPEHRTLA